MILKPILWDLRCFNGPVFPDNDEEIFLIKRINVFGLGLAYPQGPMWIPL